MFSQAAIMWWAIQLNDVFLYSLFPEFNLVFIYSCTFSHILQFLGVAVTQVLNEKFIRLTVLKVGKLDT